MMHERPSLTIGRSRLAAVVKNSGDIVHIDDVANALDVSRTQASKLLSRWTAQGLLRRVGSGAYIPVQLELLDAETVIQDPWILVSALFEPAYIGSRTAAEHWDLTEQIFRDIVVFTVRPVRTKTREIQNAIFTLKHVRKELIFGTKPVWRGQSKLAVSDIHRTVIDMLDDPVLGGGVQHVYDCFGQYLQRPDCDTDNLILYADRMGNGAIFKRLGFLAELSSSDSQLIEACRERITKGHAKLDPNLDCNNLVTRWRLRVPDSWAKRQE